MALPKPWSASAIKGMFTAFAMRPAFSTISVSVSRPASGTPKTVAQAFMPDMYATLKPTASAIFACSAQPPPGRTKNSLFSIIRFKTVVFFIMTSCVGLDFRVR